MATSNVVEKSIEEEKIENQASRAFNSNRRYVGTKETIAYIIYDISASFNISKYNDIFITDIVQIGLRFQTIISAIVGIWDVINDVILATIVDRTRTRFGKFKPYLILYAGPGLILTLVYWILPIMFANTGPYNVTKIVFFMILQLVSNFAGSLNNIAKTGMLSTITPNVIERTRLITQANLFSGFIEKAPQILMGLFIDFVNHGVFKIKMRTLYVSAGYITSIIGGAMALFFAIVAKERVLQKVEKPSILQGFKSILNNKPLLILTIEEFLNALGINSGIDYYYINVLGLASMSTIVGIPGALVSPTSYAFVTKAREKFSTRTLWIVSSHTSDILMIIVFLVGSINRNYKRLSVMIPAFMIRETLWMSVYGLHKVIPEELRNETLDYGEWKNGYRSEGITGVAKGLASKLCSTIGTSFKTFLLSCIGYREGAGFGGQSAKTEFLLFMCCTLVPALSALIGIIPKFFYDINGEKRERMYRELHERRKAVIDHMKEVSDNIQTDETDATDKDNSDK